ncbi:MAG: ABC transporter substrate-binding protein [Treponema sp.]|jgi:peptide/nickel transport system substrate-binding protein|nr:ABC transporter substrate-binding protein [Treponema sp.]
MKKRMLPHVKTGTAMKRSFIVTAGILSVIFFACSKEEEYSAEEFEALGSRGINEILEKTVSKPWRGEEFVPGAVKGTWNSVVQADPKSFNLLVAETDSPTAAVTAAMTDYFIDYDTVKREWKARAAFFEVIVDEENDTLKVIYTLRDNLYWSYYNSSQKIPVTSDDVIFWYNEISGDPECQSSAYYQQFLTMSDGSEAHVDIERISDKKFSFNFPRIVAEPLLATNMSFGPAHIYKKAKDEGGVQAVRDLYSVASDPKTIPSMGEWFLAEYIPGQRMVYKRNPDYWDLDKAGTSVPYVEENIVQIIPDENTQKLIFMEGRTETYSLRPEDLDEMAGRQEAGSYTVFNAEGSLGASYWTFNQHPVHSGSPKYNWFTKKEFRQAMSCLLNRERIINQVYRGLAEPKLDFFPEPNPFYNPEIKLKYLYDQKKALALLESAGFRRDSNGILRDDEGNAVEFDLSIRSESTIMSDIASIIMNELDGQGIKVNIRVLDFQKLVEQLFSTFEWDSMLMGLSGSNIFPSQGSNVWPSSGNLHMWYPNQAQPATAWEARIDYLYNEGSYTIDREKARTIWNEYQEIILEEMPVISLLRSRGFWALRNRWDFSNVYFDNINGAETSHIFLK